MSFNNKLINHSCVSEYISKYGNDINNYKSQIPIIPTINITHTDGRSWKNNNNKVCLNNGDDINLTKYNASNVYDNINSFALFEDGSSAYSIKQQNNNIYLQPFKPNNSDFSWKFIPIDNLNNSFYIYNDFNNGSYVGYDSSSDSVNIGQESNKISWLINSIINDNGSYKMKRKALSIMAMGQGNYNNQFKEINSCVLPKETKNLLNLDNSCLLRNKDTQIITNSYLKKASGIPMNINSIIAAEDISNGIGVYPDGGCSITTDEKYPGFQDTVNDIADAINYDNNKILLKLYNEIELKRNTLNDLITNIIPNNNTILISTINNYNIILNNCNSQEDLQNSLNSEINTVNQNLQINNQLVDNNNTKLNQIHTILSTNIKLCGYRLLIPNFPAFDLGPIGIKPWGNIINYPDQNARWIWNTNNAATSAPKNIQIIFQRQWNNSTGKNINAKIYVIVDDYAHSININNYPVLINTKNGKNYEFYRGWLEYEKNIPSSFTFGNIILIPGINILSLTVSNLEGPAGLIYSIINNDNNQVLFNSDTNTVYSTNNNQVCFNISGNYNNNNSSNISTISINPFNGFGIINYGNSLGDCLIFSKGYNIFTAYTSPDKNNIINGNVINTTNITINWDNGSVWTVISN